MIVDDLIPTDLYEPLCEAADRVTEKGRQGEWDNVRIVGKQFPPWSAEDRKQGTWGVQNIMHPDLNEPIFAEWYGSDDMLDVSAALMGVGREAMQFGESFFRRHAARVSLWLLGVLLFSSCERGAGREQGSFSLAVRC